jgi:hypothetical protein
MARMFQLFLRARAHNLLNLRREDKSFKARSVERDAETDGVLTTPLRAHLLLSETAPTNIWSGSRWTIIIRTSSQPIFQTASVGSRSWRAPLRT